MDESGRVSAGELVSCANGCVGSENVGYLGTVTTITAAVASSVAGWYTSQTEGGMFKGKTPVMLVSTFLPPDKTIS